MWARITSATTTQRDQIDHFRSLVFMLKSSDEYLDRILDRRLHLAKAHAAPEYAGDVGEVFFSGKTVLIPGTSVERSWHGFLTKSARERPRDLVQLLFALSEQALADRKSKIDSDVVKGALYQYSEERVRDLCLEFENDCPQLRVLIDAAASLDWECDPETLRRHLLTIPGRTGITLRGTVLKPNNVDNMFSLWSFLFETGFLNARVPDMRKDRHFRHIMFKDEPHLVSFANWNEMQKMTWEIHPAYHSYLSKRQEDERARRAVASLGSATGAKRTRRKQG